MALHNNVQGTEVLSMKTAMNYIRRLVWILLLSSVVHAADEKLYVFYPLTIRPQQVQELLQKNLTGVSVTVFGRVNDFKARIGLDPPDAILTKPALVEQLNGFIVSIKGIRDGSSEEKYRLISINRQIDIDSVTSETVIGVIDVLGRTAMKAFIAGVFPVEPKLKQVTKIEDLLPLLTFSMANGILIEDIFVDYFRKTSNLSFKISPPLPSKKGIIVLSYRKDSSGEAITAEQFKGNPVISRLFEIEKWKP